MLALLGLSSPVEMSLQKDQCEGKGGSKRSADCRADSIGKHIGPRDVSSHGRPVWPLLLGVRVMLGRSVKGLFLVPVCISWTATKRFGDWRSPGCGGCSYSCGQRTNGLGTGSLLGSAVSSRQNAKIAFMRLRVPSLGPTTGVVAFYMAGDCRWAESELAGDLLGATVFCGEGRLNMARAAAGRGSLVWLDPASYDRPHSREDDLRLFPCEPWADDQRSVGVTELLSPGASVPSGDVRALDKVISSQAMWLADQGGGRLSLVVDPWWLTEGLQTLVTRLRQIEGPIAVALEDQNDPLRRQGAVNGLATIASGVDNLMVLRCDMGALGAVAHGATVAAIGTGTSVRHVVPRGKRAGGGRNHIPKVFVEGLLDFRSSELLSRLPRRIKPACGLACCNGAALDRFHYTADGLATARVHNLRSLANVTNQVLSASAAERPAVWKRMTTDATAAARRIELEGGQPFGVRPQIVAWATL